MSSEDNFLKLSVSSDVLKFGSYTLKSGRISPYFFNSSLFDTGKVLYNLGMCYARKIVKDNIKFDVLFGPAYKGISLAAIVSTILYKEYNLEIGYAYNRKEKKGYADDCILVGSSVQHRKVLIIDDVITSGIAVRQAIDILNKNFAEVVGVIIAFDRQEIDLNNEKFFAVDRIRKDFNFYVSSIATLDDLITYVKINTAYSPQLFSLINNYRNLYGKLSK